MRIAITADPYIPVPPSLYGGIERVIAFLTAGLVKRGHAVTLFAHPDSAVAGAALVGYGMAPHAGFVPRLAELVQVGSALSRRYREFDIVHSFGRLAALLPILPVRSCPKIQSYQREVSWSGVRRAQRIARSSLQFTACSQSVFRAHADDPTVGRWQAIFNGVDLGAYRAVEAVPSDAPLVFLGRVERVKGVHVAIEVARRSGRRLVVAGNVAHDGAEREYFEREIRPAIDGRLVEYVGPVDDRAKNALLGSAAALLFPTMFEEPFGIVMAEAMACGTPVVAFARGAVPEVIIDGVNGFACDDVDQLVAAVGRLSTISRAAVRADCERRFSADVIVSQYEALYRHAVS
jgi:glycosyltransferase involved in cell wall biosynthesis